MRFDLQPTTNDSKLSQPAKRDCQSVLFSEQKNNMKFAMRVAILETGVFIN